jgi:hypothetical protein
MLVFKVFHPFVNLTMVHTSKTQIGLTLTDARSGESYYDHLIALTPRYANDKSLVNRILRTLPPTGTVALRSAPHRKSSHYGYESRTKIIRS